jgi:transcriptional antiterminator RfaH
MATNLSVVRTTMGVSQFVRFGTVPAMPHAWVEAMREKSAVHETQLKSGDKVLLSGGMFKGLEAVYMHSDGDMRSMVLIELLSKKHLIPYEVQSLLPQTS